ncbi:MAG TPA: MFS transporter [Fimbriimonadaceae bacterium]|nr:MFS transporter [Fimbriimonadaceae bacterium]
MGGAFRALQYRNYRLFFGGQTLSLVGSWMETVAMGWLVWRLTGSSLLLGTVAFCSQIPAFIVSPVAGITAEKYDKRKILTITQSLMALEAFVLAALTLTGIIRPWHIILTSVFVGIVSAFDMPTRQSFVITIVEDKKVLGNAIALNSAQFNIARLIGPAIAGVTVAAIGEGYCFLINGISFAAVLGALAMMRLYPHMIRDDQLERPLERVRQGATYAWNHKPISYLLQLMAITSLVSGAYSVMLPILTSRIFHRGSEVFGLMYSAVAVGALIAVAMLATRPSVVGLGRWIFYASVIFNLGLIGLAFSPVLWVALISLVVVGFGSMKHMASTNSVIQTLVDDRMRGRVMAFYMMSFVGTMPIGSFVGGLLADRIGPQNTLAASAAVGLLGSVLYFVRYPRMRQIMRPIYEEMGLLENARAAR